MTAKAPFQSSTHRKEPLERIEERKSRQRSNNDSPVGPGGPPGEQLLAQRRHFHIPEDQGWESLQTHSTQPPGVTKWGDHGPERARHLPKITQQASSGAGTTIMPFTPSSVPSAQGPLSHPSLLARPPLGAWAQPPFLPFTVSAPGPTWRGPPRGRTGPAA